MFIPPLVVGVGVGDGDVVVVVVVIVVVAAVMAAVVVASSRPNQGEGPPESLLMPQEEYITRGAELYRPPVALLEPS
eukprot:1698799-Pyramimonas_sp.AAC.1